MSVQVARNYAEYGKLTYTSQTGDHSNSLVHYCHLLGMSNITEKDKVLMAGIDQNGFDLKVNGENIRFELETPMKEAREVRKVLVSLAKKPLI